MAAAVVQKDLIAGRAVPAGLSDARVIPIVRFLEQCAELDGPPAANVVTADRYRRAFVHRRGARKSAELFARDALHLRADISPRPMLNPKTGTMAILDIDAKNR